MKHVDDLKGFSARGNEKMRQSLIEHNQAEGSSINSDEGEVLFFFKFLKIITERSRKIRKNPFSK